MLTQEIINNSMHPDNGFSAGKACAHGAADRKTYFLGLPQGVELFTGKVSSDLDSELCAILPATSIKLWRLSMRRTGDVAVS